MEPKPKNLKQSDIEIPERIEPKTVLLLASLATLTSSMMPMPTEQDFLDLADRLEENGAEELYEDAMAFMLTILRGEGSAKLE